MILILSFLLALDCETSYKRCGIFLWEFLSEYECYELYDEEVKHKDILSWIGTNLFLCNFLTDKLL